MPNLHTVYDFANESRHLTFLFPIPFVFIGLIVLIFFSAFWLYKSEDFEPLIVVLGYFISLVINSVTILFNNKEQKPVLLAHEQYATHLKNIVTSDAESKPLYFFV